jgi:anti-sigma regulatory factor (Ser/Thr protein kinase)
VPLNRPAEPLAPGPRGAMQARRWVADVCAAIGRPELRDNAELALSEVVTNAILHGKPPVTVRLRGTATHPRVEVRDASPDEPRFPQVEAGQEFMGDLPTFGRGLTIVAHTSEAWGAERDGDGKLVWFEPSALSQSRAAPGAIEGWDDEPEEPPFATGEALVIHLIHVPAEALQGTLAHAAELRREVRLLALAHQDTYPVASDLSAFFTAHARDFRGQLGGEPLLHALLTGSSHLDLDVKAPLDASERFSRLQELLDLADAFCRNERLLTLARSDTLVAFQSWMYGEFVRQGRGEDAVPWVDGGQSWLSRAHP